jgi:hypothetical protein
MEAKVDVRKLQILNDRINQTIDALNQVRLSVHGLGHSGGLQSQFNPYLTQGYGMQQPYGMGAPGLGFQQGMQGGFPGYGHGIQGGFPGFGQQSPFGFQHSPFQQLANPYLSQGLISPWSQIGSPWSVFGQTGQTGMGGIGGGFGAGGFGGLGGGLGQLYGGIGGGLGHTSPDVIERQLAEARANDPFRITQTFPFVVS